MEILNWKFNYW